MCDIWSWNNLHFRDNLNTFLSSPQNSSQETAKSTHRSWRSVSSGQTFVRGEEMWLAACRGSLQMKIRQIFRSISDPGAFIIQQVTWTGELKFQYIGSDLYSRIKWLEVCNLTSWTSWSLRKTGANQPQRHLLHSFHVCSDCCTEGRKQRGV